MSPALWLLAIAVVVGVAMWLSLRAVPSDLDGLPIGCRRRITWWQLNARWLYAGCAVLAMGAGLMHLST
jgi:hypothetical protein